MAVLPLAIFPDPVLRKPTREVTEFDEALAALVVDLWESMHAHDGVGLAAPQVGVSLRIAVIAYKEARFTLVNPRVVEAEGEMEGEEGCLSFPGIFERIIRPKRIVVEAFDEKGCPFRTEVEDFLARAFLHEIDHLEGRLLIDHLSPLKRQMLKKKMVRRKKEES